MRPLNLAVSSMLMFSCLLGSCERKPSPTTAAPAAATPAVEAEPPWIPANDLGDWKPLTCFSQADVKVVDGVLQMANGDGVSGVRYAGKRPIPVVDYELSWEAMKVRGVDFFGAATFPVRDLKTCVTLINGGWGGGVTGISSIDRMSAQENATTTMVPYKLDQWYKFRVHVTAEMIAAFVDDKMIFKILIKDKVVGLRPGEIEECAPFGFATYMTKGAVRNIHFRDLKPGELKTDADSY